MSAWHKFGAVRTERDGLKFRSKAEARYYDYLKAQIHAGEVSFFLREVPFYTPGNVRYVADFMVFCAPGPPCPTCGVAAGEIKVVDVKGVETPVFKLKKRLIKEHFGLDIEVTK